MRTLPFHFSLQSKSMPVTEEGGPHWAASLLKERGLPKSCQSNLAHAPARLPEVYRTWVASAKPPLLAVCAYFRPCRLRTRTRTRILTLALPMQVGR